MARHNLCFHRKMGFIALLLVLCTLIAGIGSMAAFTDRVSYQSTITTFTFSADGYHLETEHPKDPFIAGENVKVKLRETNENQEKLESLITMSVTWSSPDPNCSIFGNVTSSDNATISIGGTSIPITNGMLSADHNTVTFALPAHAIDGGATKARDLLLHIPDSLKGTGQLSFVYENVNLEPASGGFSADIGASELAEHNFSVNVGWAASSIFDNNGKYLMGYLKSASAGKYTIEYRLEYGATSSGMKNFTSATDSKWSYYRNDVVGLTFPEGMTSVGNYAFAQFKGVSSVAFPSTTSRIGASAFNASGLTDELVFPATVTNIESLAFGNLPGVDTITFKHTSNTLTLPDNTSSGNKEKGAFYLPEEDFVETKINSRVEEIQYGYKWHNDHRRAIPTLSLENYWMWLYDEENDDYITPIDSDLLTKVEFVDYYMADGSEIELTTDYDPSVSGVYYWDGSDASVPNTVTIYLSADKSTLTVAGNGYGLIFANEDSSYVFSELVSLKTVENTDILDTRNATTMNWMFGYCPELEDLDVSTWNVSKVEDMSGMFYCCDSLESMDLSKGTYTAKDGSGTYEAWNTASLKHTDTMFMLYGGPKFSLSSVDLTDWDTSKLETAYGMFWECKNLTEVKGISDWNVSALQDAECMFIGCESLETIDLSEWQTTSLTSTMAMFAWCESLQGIDISGWDMSKVTNTARMFAGCENFKELTLPATLAVFGDNFAAQCPQLTTITFLQPAGMDLTFPAEGTNISYDGAFYVPNNGKEEGESGYVAYRPKSPLGTKVITNNSDVLNYAWSKDCRGYTVQVETVTGGTLTANPTTAINGITITLAETPSDDYSYEGATVRYSEKGINKVVELDKNTKTFTMPAVDDKADAADVVVTPKWKVSAIPMLAKRDTWQYTSIDEETGTYTTPIDFALLETINIVTSYTPSADEVSWDASAYETVNGVEYMGKVTAYLSVDKKTLTLAGNGYDCIFANPDSAWAFSSWDNWGFASLTSIHGAEWLETGLVTNASSMFSMNEKLQYLNVSNWDTSNIEITNETGYYGIFMNCKSLAELDIATKTVTRADGTSYTAWDTGSMIETIRMFSGCSLLEEIDVSGWDMSSCYSTADMFSFTPISEIAVNGWDTSTLYDSYGMFEGCKNLTEIDLSTWNVSKLDYTHSMFRDSGLTKIDLSSWTESVVTRAYAMFAGCTNLTDVNIVGWNLSNLETATNDHYKSSAEMFSGCTALEKLTLPASLKVFGPHFAAGCTSLTTIEFQHDAATDLLFASPGNYDGAFYLDAPYAESAPLGTIVITSNEDVLNYGWSKDSRGFTVHVETVTGGTLTATPTTAINGKTITLAETPSGSYSYEGATVRYSENGTNKVVELDKNTKTFVMPVVDDKVDAADVVVTPKWELSVLPMLKVQNSWRYVLNPETGYYESPIDSSLLEKVNFVTSYTPAADEISWDASAYETVDGVEYSGTVTAYLSADKKTLTLSGNGSDRIYAHPDSSLAFAYFGGVTSYDNIEMLDTSNTTDMSSMFSDNYSVTDLEVGHFDTSKVTTLYGMFYLCYSVPELDVTNWDTGEVTNMHGVFTDCTKLQALHGIRNWDTRKVTNMYRMFLGTNSIPSLDLSSQPVTLPNGKSYDSWDTGEVKNMAYMFGSSDSSPHAMETLNITTFDMRNVTQMQAMFERCTSLKTLDVTPRLITLNGDPFYSWDVGKVHRMDGLFRDCSSLISLDLSHWDTSSVGTDTFTTIDDFSEMFMGCTSLETLNVSRTYMSGINFRDYTSWDTSNALHMDSMFEECSSLQSLNLKNWSNAKVTDMSDMFCYCSAMTSIDLTNFTTPSVENMSNMFYECSSLTDVNVSSFDTRNATKISYMFYSCSSLKKLDVSNFDTSNVPRSLRGTNGFAQNCTSLTEIVLGPNFIQDKNMPAAGADQGLFYVGAPYSTSNLLGTKVTGANSVMSGYNWANDFRGYTVAVAAADHGSVEANPTATVSGNTVALTPEPNLGYAYAGSEVSWTENGSNQGMSISKDILSFEMPSGNVTIKPHFTAIPYSIRYETNGGTLPADAPTDFTIESAALTLPTPTRENYHFSGWYETVDYSGEKITQLPQGSTGNKTLYAKWTVKRADYTVKHWAQNLSAPATQNSSNYTLHATDSYQDNAGTQVTPAVKSITGFTAPDQKTVIIKEDGSTVINYYYTRNSYTFTLGSSTGIDTSGSSASGTYQYGATITLKASTNKGYEWTNWTSSNTKLVDNLTESSTTFTMPAGDITMTPNAIRAVYLTHIATTPVQIDYNEGDSFQKSDVVVKAHYSDDSSKVIDNYTISGNTTNLTRNQTNLTFSYTEGGITKTAELKLRVFVPFTITKENRAAVGFTGAENENLVITDFYDETEQTWYRPVAIADRAFTQCSNLRSVQLPDSIESIDQWAFYFCDNLTTINIPDKVTSISNYTFYYCTSLTEIDLPDGLTYIGNSAFNYCKSLQRVEIPAGVSTISSYAFYYCLNLTEVSLPSGLTTILDYAFGSCKRLESIDIPAGVTSFGPSAFASCGFTSIGPADSGASIEIPSGITVLKKNLFAGCQNLTNVRLPSTVTSMEDAVFSNCTSLTSIGAAGSGADFEFPTSVTTLSKQLFKGCSGLTKVRIPSYITTFGTYAFDSCNGLTSIGPAGSGADFEIPSHMTALPEGTFQWCTGLADVVIPDYVTSIPSYTFWNCSYIERLVLPTGITNIAHRTFGLASTAHVYYRGSEEQWKAITIAETGNDTLLNATMHYNYTP